MSYTQTIYDSFTSGTFNTSLWTRSSSTTIVQGSGVITSTPTANYDQLVGTNFNWDISAGNIVACKIGHSGTGNSSTEVYIGVQNSGGQALSLLSNIGAANNTIDAEGGATIASIVSSGTGITSSWTNGTWLGCTMSGTTITFYSSTDGQTWTAIAHGTVGGTFDPAHCSFVAVAGIFSGSTPTWRTTYDDVSIFVPASSTPGKVRKSAAWATPTALKVRKGGAWETPSAVKVRKAGAWVTAS